MLVLVLIFALAAVLPFGEWKGWNWRAALLFAPTSGVSQELFFHSALLLAMGLLVTRVLEEITKVFDFNRRHKGSLEVGIDGQISNWAIVNFDPGRTGLKGEFDLHYFDTSAPFICRDGEEQLDPELFLRSAPSFLVWILRLLFLEDVMTRYYDYRKVCIDLIANFYKEGRPELISGLVSVTNEFLNEHAQGEDFNPLIVDEISSYYREDAWIWRLYLMFRKVDRSLYRFLGKYYPYTLPDKVSR